MRFLVALLTAFVVLSACDGTSVTAGVAGTAVQANQSSAVAGAQESSASSSAPGKGVSLEATQAKLELKILTEPWTGDLDGMIKRRVIRVLTVYGLGRYFLDGPQESGFVYEIFKAYEATLNKELRTGPLKMHIVFIPVSRDELLPGLISGRGDIAAAGLTITPVRQEIVQFSLPVSKEIHEILVTGPSAPEIETLDDLAGQTVHVRLSSSYYESLLALSQQLLDAGKPEIDIQAISELLEDEDLLEMVQAGLLPWVVVDDYKAKIWTQVFDQLVVRDDLVLRIGGRLAYAFRKDSPQLAESLNNFLKTHREGTLLGNVLINRNFRDFDWVKNALSPKDLRRFHKVEGIFMKYGEQYGFDYLMVAAQGYQESRLDQSKRSKAGAIGVMQLLPTTAADPNVGIPNITDEESNIHAGIKYLDFIRTRYFDDLAVDQFNRTLMAFASYNAGPARVQGLRKKAASQGLDPNVWFANVEIVAAREIGNETVQYVSNIYKYYITYRMLIQHKLTRADEREAHGLGATPDKNP